MSTPPSLEINRNTNYTVVSKNLDATERDSVIRKTTIHTISLYNKDRHIQSSKCLIISSKKTYFKEATSAFVIGYEHNTNKN